ncbi:MAG: radical SAM protein [Bacteroidales bacterium]|nr:radical SAM protein [Bacteroidales bacterium]MBQ9311849.1 radical SAM protein [Bacteroidales bacterium]
MNIYSLLKANRIIKSNRLKLAGILSLHSMKRRYFGIFFDPILACNLRCKMCYFSDEEKRKSMQGAFSKEEIDLIAEKFFPYSLKLQIGCGAEPTMYKNLAYIISKAKEKKVPYISMTTNANLLKKEDLENYIQQGLNEITVSLHGTNKETYEDLMTNGSFSKFQNALLFISDLKKKYPNFKLRINYTMNSDNVLQLKDFFKVFDGIDLDIIQLRPIVNLGETTYKDFSWQNILSNYEQSVGTLKEECIKRNITLICPEKKDLTKETNNEGLIFEYTYIYISPKEVYRKDFSLKNDTFFSYNKRKHLKKELLKKIFSKNLSSTLKSKLNYNIN